jgi:hypothetical protein
VSVGWIQGLLNDCVVTIDSDAGLRAGGFFVAPNQILTLAEVADEVQVNGQWGDTRWLAGVYRQQHVSHQLAELHIESVDFAHPCVRLASRPPAEGTRVLIVGRKAATPAVCGRVLRDRIELRVNPPGQVTLGAPVLDLQRGEVCGVAAGGYAIPVGVDSHLLRAHDLYHDTNRDWIDAQMRLDPPPLTGLLSASEEASLLGLLARTRGPRPPSLNALYRRCAQDPELYPDPHGLRDLRDLAESLAWLNGYGSHLHPVIALAETLASDYPDYAHDFRSWATTVAFRLDEYGMLEQRRRDESPDLVLRIYIPAGRLYAAEASRILLLFHEWLTKTHGPGIRRSTYSTVNGETVEFYVDPSTPPVDLRAELGAFTGFLGRCERHPETAIDQLNAAGMATPEAVDLVAKFAREARRLRIELRQDREKRVLTLTHSVESELEDRGIDTADLGIMTEIDRMLPRPSLSQPLGVLPIPGAAVPGAAGQAPVTVNIQSMVMNNIQGNVNLVPRARELLELIQRSGGPDTPELESALYELEDADAPPEARNRAKRRLRTFLTQIAGTVRDISVDVLEKYLESKLG